MKQNCGLHNTTSAVIWAVTSLYIWNRTADFITLRGFRLPPRWKWDLPSCGILWSVDWQLHTDVSGQPIGPIFKGQVFQEERWSLVHLIDPPLPCSNVKQDKFIASEKCINVILQMKLQYQYLKEVPFIVIYVCVCKVIGLKTANIYCETLFSQLCWNLVKFCKCLVKGRVSVYTKEGYLGNMVPREVKKILWMWEITF